VHYPCNRVSSLSVFSCVFVHVWIILLDEIYLRKVGWVFPQVWGFPRITLCVFLCLFMLLIFSLYGI
jgi:hypothetical protein